MTLDFGDYCQIEQKRFGCDNEMYLYKVVGRLQSNCYADVPVHAAATEHAIHDEIVPVLRCICCGVCEDRVFKFRESDCLPVVRGGNALTREES